MATIWDVAARAGVSKSTVSLVINGSPMVKAETREKVLEAIEELRYVPNNNARNLQRKHNNSIGIIHVLRSNRNPDERYSWDGKLEIFSHEVEEGIFSAIVECDTDMSILVEHFNIQENPNEMPRILRECRVDGAIFIGGFDKKCELDFIKNVKVPVVMVTSPLEMDSIDTVMHDTALGCKIAFEKLIETGHKKICLLNIPKRYRVWPQRVEAAKAAAKEMNYNLLPEHIISVEHNTAHGAYDALNALLDRGITPDGIVTADNELAMGAVRCLWERGLRIPEDISLICYEDSAFCGNASPALSAINIQKNTIGHEALHALLDRMENPDLPIKSITVEPYLVMRDSVKNRK